MKTQNIGAADRLARRIAETYGELNEERIDYNTRLIADEFRPLIEAAEWAERELLRLGVADNDKELGKHKQFADFMAALRKVR